MGGIHIWNRTSLGYNTQSVIFSIKQLITQFCRKKMLKKYTVHIESKNPWPVPVIYHECCLHIYYTLSGIFIGVVVADMV